MGEEQQLAHGGSLGAGSALASGAAVGRDAVVRAEGIGAIAALRIGDVHQHVYPSARAPVSWPHVVGVVAPLTRSFQARAERPRLQATASGGATVALCQVLVGMGGVGKTQLAADFAEQAWDGGRGVDLLVWATASSRDAIVAVYAQAGVEVCGADPSDPAQAAQVFLAWLRSGVRRWLVVLDDLADPGDLRGLRPPAVPQGRTVVTTRRRDTARAAGGTVIEVGLFTPGEAVTYLGSELAAEGRTGPPGDLAGLAEDLGWLPLALSQAAAYIADAGITVGEYRELVAGRARSLADISPDVPSDDQAHSMAAAWGLSVERADRLSPAGLARPMLHLVAFLAPSATPLMALTSGPALRYLTDHRTPNPDPPSTATAAGPARPVTQADAVGALRALHRLSLLTAPGPPAVGQHEETGGVGSPVWDGRLVQVHQIVQRATRDTLTPHQYHTTARAAGDTLLAVWPDIERDAALAQTLRANAAALTRHAEDVLYECDGVHGVLVRAGSSLGNTGQVAAAAEHFQRIADVAQGRLGPDHSHTLAARGTLVRWRGESGDVAGAAEASVELLEHMGRVLGDAHFVTLAARGNVARFRGEAGDAAGAVEILASLLADQAQGLGDEHPYILAVRGELVRWRWKAGDTAGATAASDELLEHMERVLGNEHVSTLSTRGNIACFRGQAGDAAGAVDAFAELLADQVRVLGDDHPDTLTTRHNLACFRGEAGDAAGAADAFAELLADRVRVLGADHPSTLTTRGNIAYWQGEAGDAAGAADAFAELLADRVRVLGDDHPDTLASRRFVARWRGRAGDAAGATDAYTDLVQHMVRVAGPDHPDTLTARGNVAYWRGKAGDAAGAADAFAELLADRVRVLGADHSSTLTTRHNLAWSEGEAGDAAGAAAAFAELLADRERVLGADHPDTIATRPYADYWRVRQLLGHRPPDEQDQ